MSFDDQKCQDELQICDVPDRAGEQSNADTSADMRHSLKSKVLKGGYTGDCIGSIMGVIEGDTLIYNTIVIVIVTVIVIVIVVVVVVVVVIVMAEGVSRWDPGFCMFLHRCYIGS